MLIERLICIRHWNKHLTQIISLNSTIILQGDIPIHKWKNRLREVKYLDKDNKSYTSSKWQSHV